ncbi:MAG: hypothetical protein JRF02_01375 [Deltaproteobacteria bacterium]|jgi:hypothetical protein|nr:hypothetical protein [Deltaproteobacteria bacterium]
MRLPNNLRTGTQNLGPLIVLCVGIHSIFLGLFIYFFTDLFYRLFFAAAVENIFFVRQSGIFLFLAGLFYLYPLINLEKLYNLILVVIFSKITAVYFLVANARFTLSPKMIYLAAFFDGLMAVLLLLTYLNLKKTGRLEKEIPGKGQFVMSDK